MLVYNNEDQREGALGGHRTGADYFFVGQGYELLEHSLCACS